jgi:hypothetical protein
MTHTRTFPRIACGGVSSVKKLFIFLPLLALSANAAIVMSDNFNGNLSTQTNTPPSGWSQSNGSVDILLNGYLGLPCRGGTGACIDLDGSTGNAGDLAFNTTFLLTAGNTYTLTYWLAGSQRGDSNTVTVSLGGASQQHTLISSTPYTQFSLVVNPLVNVNGAQIVFSHEGTDNLGLLLDDVSLDETTPTTSAVPEPSSAALLAGGFAALAFLRRRRR